MVIEKQPQGNHSSVVCEREYELRTSSSDFNSTFPGETEDLSTESLGHDTFDWTNRQSGLMLGMGLRGLSPMMDISQMSAEPKIRWLFLWIRSDDAVCWVYFSIFRCTENHDRSHVDFKYIQFCLYLYHHHSKVWVSLAT